MSAESAQPVDYAVTFDDVQAAEREWLARRRAAAGMPPVQDDAVGLAFSGGGIRSATFNLGVLQALEAGGILPKVDYLSSVSGGGYVASCYSWLRARVDPVPPDGAFAVEIPGSGGSVLDWLRGHGKYLVSQRGFSIWTLIASIFASTLVNVLVLGPPLLAVVYALTLDWLPLAWPDWLSLPGGHVPSGNHGFLLLLFAGGLFACFLHGLARAISSRTLPGTFGSVTTWSIMRRTRRSTWSLSAFPPCWYWASPCPTISLYLPLRPSCARLRCAWWLSAAATSLSIRPL